MDLTQNMPGRSRNIDHGSNIIILRSYISTMEDKLQLSKLVMIRSEYLCLVWPEKPKTEKAI